MSKCHTNKQVSYMPLKYQSNLYMPLPNYSIANHYHKFFLSLSAVANIRSVSTCVTSLSITWDAPSTTCGVVSYEMLASQSPNEESDNFFSGTELDDRSVEVAELDNSLRDVTVTVTAIDMVGRRSHNTHVLQLLMAESKFV